MQRSGTDLLTLSSKYLDHSENQYTLKVYKEKQQVCKSLIKIWGQDTLAKEITPEMIFDYLSDQKNARSANAANKDRKNLSALFAWGQEVFGYDEIPFNPVQRIKKFKHQVKAPKTYTESDILKLLVAATRWEKLVLRTYLETAGRRMEVLGLTWDDVNLEKRAIRLWTRKTSNGEPEGTWLPISKELTAEFRWLFDRYGGRWVFINNRTRRPYVDPRKWYNNLCTRAKVRNLGFHALRRYVASIMDDKHKISKKAIQNLLRHKKESTTERYLHMIHSDLKDYVGLAIPKAKETEQGEVKNEY